MRKILLIFFLLQTSVQCNAQTSNDDADSLCTFTNPIAWGADPWVFEKDDVYYFSESGGGGIHISSSKIMTEIKSNSKQVWRQPDTDWNASNLWAPELHFIQGRWYIYYTAGESALYTSKSGRITCSF